MPPCIRSQFGVYSRYNRNQRGAQKFIRPQHELGESHCGSELAISYPFKQTQPGCFIL
ncbi:MAG: hypothetical protein IPL04_17755 [Chitinophagaceae bacterium]|nr:hypothetical protein [Chitinophagaceae bacterium]